MKKTISWLMALAMLLCLVPYSAMATDSENLIFDMDLSEYTAENNTVKNAVENSGLTVTVNDSPSVGKINQNNYLTFGTSTATAVTVSEEEGKENTIFKNQSMTFELWARTNQFVPNANMKRLFVLTEKTSVTADGYSLIDVPVYDGQLWFRPYFVTDGEVTRSYTYKYKMTDYNEQWKHIVLVREYDASADAVTAALYINGVKITETAKTAEPGTRNSHPDPMSLIIGNKGAYGSGFIGDIAEFRMYNSALTADSVKSKYDATADKYVDAELVFDMDLSDYTDSNMLVKNSVGTALDITVNGSPILGTVNKTKYLTFGANQSTNTAVTVSEEEGKENSIFKNQSMTFELWARTDQFVPNANMKRLFVLTERTGESADGYNLIDVPVYAGQLWFRPYFVTNGDATRSYTYKYKMTDYNEQWKHIVLVREYDASADAVTAALYINGVKITETAKTTEPGTRNSHPDPMSLIIGNKGKYGSGFIGDIAEFKMYKIALSEKSVQSKYKASAVKFTQLSKIKYTDANGAIITNLEGVNYIKAESTLNNYVGAAPIAVLAAYDASGALVKVNFAKAVAAAEGFSITVELNNLSLTADSDVRLFVWKDLSTMTPLLEAVPFAGGGV